MGYADRKVIQVKTQQKLKLIIKHKKHRPVELAIYNMTWGKSEGSFLMPLFENRLPQMFFDKRISRVTRKLKGFKMFMTYKINRKYL